MFFRLLCNIIFLCTTILLQYSKILLLLQNIIYTNHNLFVMKHKGCVFAFTEQRNDELISAYRKAIRNKEQIVIEEVAVEVAESPCSRFWVSEERAMAVMSELLNGHDILPYMRPLRREMYEEIFRRVTEERERNPDMYLGDIVFNIVNSPAPKFYLRPRCVMDIVYKVKNGYYDDRNTILR